MNIKTNFRQQATIIPARRHLLALLTLSLLLAALYAAFIHAPLLTAGWHAPAAQKIFYIHVPVAWTAYLGFFLVFIFSCQYLRTGLDYWDHRAKCAAELGLLFCSMALLTGMLWGRAEWGVFWRMDDLKLMLTLLLWMVYAAYLLLRANLAMENTGKLAAVFGIMGFAAVPLSFIAQRIWRSLHPTLTVSSYGAGISGSVLLALLLSVLAFTFLFFFMFSLRLSLEQLLQRTGEEEFNPANERTGHND